MSAILCLSMSFPLFMYIYMISWIFKGRTCLAILIFLSPVKLVMSCTDLNYRKSKLSSLILNIIRKIIYVRKDSEI